MRAPKSDAPMSLATIHNDYRNKKHQMQQNSDSEEESEITFSSIIKDKPSPSKVATFLQMFINDIVKEDDSDDEDNMESSEYDTDFSSRK